MQFERPTPLTTGRTVTQDAFMVAPQVIGLPLAGAARRALAMGVDLLLVVLVVQVGGLFFGLAVAWVFFRAGSGRAGRLLHPRVRAAVRAVGGVALFLGAMMVWRGCTGDDDAPEPPQAVAEREAAPEEERSGASTSAAAAPADTTPPDDLAASYADALRADDSAAVALLRPRLAAVVAADTLATLEGHVAELREEKDELRRDVSAARKEKEELESAGLLRVMARVADELGIGLGWTGLYFTAFLALWNGQTPGKRLLGIRVVRLSGAPVSFWVAFERFGGYAASLFTGLLGFFQILWDRNRQGLHDKVVETVVVRV